MGEQFLFQWFLARALMPLPAVATMNLTVQHLRDHKEDQQAARMLREDRNGYLALCDRIRRDCMMIGPPAHVGGT